MTLGRAATIFVAMAGLASAAGQDQKTPQPAQAQSVPHPASGQIQAQTQAEYDAYQAIKTKPQTSAEFEKAADDFAARFPDSNLRIVLYRGVMQSYRQAEDADKMMSAGLKVLSLNKDDPEALIVVAEIQAEHTGPMDLDREQRMEQAAGNAQHALDKLDTDLVVPAGAPPDRVEAYKKYLRSTALAIIGTVQYKRQLYAEAETTLRKALDADEANPDPVVVLSLALSLDMQKKYPEALQQATKAVDLTKEDSEVGKSARIERDRLVTQTGGDNSPQSATQNVAPNAPPASPSPQPPNPPAH
jgi:tetratricopeptide (TPR) repeat protein